MKRMLMVAWDCTRLPPIPTDAAARVVDVELVDAAQDDVLHAQILPTFAAVDGSTAPLAARPCSLRTRSSLSRSTTVNFEESCMVLGELGVDLVARGRAHVLPVPPAGGRVVLEFPDRDANLCLAKLWVGRPSEKARRTDTQTSLRFMARASQELGVKTPKIIHNRRENFTTCAGRESSALFQRARVNHPESRLRSCRLERCRLGHIDLTEPSRRSQDRRRAQRDGCARARRLRADRSAKALFVAGAAQELPHGAVLYVVPSDGDLEEAVADVRFFSARSKVCPSRPPSARSCRFRRTKSIRTADWRRTSA